MIKKCKLLDNQNYLLLIIKIIFCCFAAEKFLPMKSEPVHEKTNNLGFRIRSDTNRPVQSQKMFRGWKFWIRVAKTGPDQLRSYCKADYREADLSLCFRLSNLLVFLCSGSSNIFQVLVLWLVKMVDQLCTSMHPTTDMQYMSHVMRKPTMWFPNRSETNQAVQAQKMARGWIFWV